MKLYCSVRKTWVATTPEEEVRQATIEHLVERLGFPISCIAVEKELKTMPHVFSEHVPERRLDILCYAREKEKGIYPLLLIECKAVKISSKELRQVIGYNYYLKAPFIALVNQTEKRLGWFDPKLEDYQFINYFPHYSELIQSLT